MTTAVVTSPTVDSLTAENGRLLALLVSEAMATASLADGLSQAHAQLVQSVDTLCSNSEMPLNRADVQTSARHVALYMSFLRHTAELAREQSDAAHAHVAAIQQKMDATLEVNRSLEASAAMHVTIPLGSSTTGASAPWKPPPPPKVLQDSMQVTMSAAHVSKDGPTALKRAGLAGCIACLPRRFPWRKTHVDMDARPAPVAQSQPFAPAAPLQQLPPAVGKLPLLALKTSPSAAPSAVPCAAPSAAPQAAMTAIVPPMDSDRELEVCAQPAAAASCAALINEPSSGAKGESQGTLTEPVNVRPASPVTQVGLGSLAQCDVSDVRAQLEQIQFEVAALMTPSSAPVQSDIAASIPPSATQPVPRLHLDALVDHPEGEADLPTHRGTRGSSRERPPPGPWPLVPGSSRQQPPSTSSAATSRADPAGALVVDDIELSARA